MLEDINLNEDTNTSQSEFIPILDFIPHRNQQFFRCYTTGY